MFRRLIPNWAVNYGKHLPESVIASLKHNFPAKKLKVIGVTGTDGKTTTVNMIYRILKDAGKKVSMVSTINAEIAGKSYDTGFHVTSPRASMIQKFLGQAVANGDEYFVLEVTSHALEQFRVWGVPIEVGVITNVTHEHLDYHSTFDRYLHAKAKLIKGARIAILNKDDDNFNKLSKLTKVNVVSFGLHTTADVNPKKITLNLQIPGEYNLSNALAATAVARSLNISDSMIKKSLQSFTGLSGRMEEVRNNRGLKIIVDFAHTPNALENALVTLRKQTKGRVISVFGCASERDVRKRPMMGQISAKLADVTILTDEDPRHEEPMKIIDEISKGAEALGAKINKSLFKEPNRQKAITLAISLAKKGDIIGIFGKGHERSMNYKGVEKPWSDTATVQKALTNGHKD